MASMTQGPKGLPGVSQRLEGYHLLSIGSNFDSKVAIVTGGAQGIGLATAKRFLQEGATVVIVDINPGPLEKAVAELKSHAKSADNIHSIAADTADENSTKKYVAEVVNKYGRIDIGILNAGVSHAPMTIMNTPEDVWDRQMRVNARSPYLGIRYIAPVMIEKGIKGSFVLTSSVGGLQGKPYIGPYCASKWAVKCIAVTAAQELGPEGIRVNCICPGGTMTPMLAGGSFDDEQKKKILSEVPLGYFADPSEIASAMAYLASDDASYVRYPFFWNVG
jgi:NAD(P)-dependent dehydrogenase (short-subunit alcohol dehydrogenase family)